MRDKSSILTKEFYKKLGAKGMLLLTNKKRDLGSLEFILPFLKKEDIILDLACVAMAGLHFCLQRGGLK